MSVSAVGTRSSEFALAPWPQTGWDLASPSEQRTHFQPSPALLCLHLALKDGSYSLTDYHQLQPNTKTSARSSAKSILPTKTADTHVCSRWLYAQPSELMREGGVLIPVLFATYKLSRFSKISFSFAELNKLVFFSLLCTSNQSWMFTDATCQVKSLQY